MKKNILFWFLLLFLVSCSNSKDWDAFVYPNWTMVESTWKIKKWFFSLEECRNWAIWNMWNASNADYECWYKCRPSTYGLNICKKTVK